MSFGCSACILPSCVTLLDAAAMGEQAEAGDDDINSQLDADDMDDEAEIDDDELQRMLQDDEESSMGAMTDTADTDWCVPCGQPASPA